MTLQPQPVDRTLWFEAALTPDGWARDVRLTIAGGRIAGLETGAARGAGDEGGAWLCQVSPMCTATPFSAPWRA